MILLGFAWFLSILETANSPLVYTVALATGGLWGGVFLHLGVSFPSGRLAARRDRAIVIAGYLIFPGALVPALFFAGPHELGCDACPTNLLLVERDEDLANVALALRRAALRRAVRHRARPLDPALARHEPARAAPAHAGLRLRAAHLPARGDRARRRGRRRLVGRLHLLRAAAVRLPRRPAAQPRLAARRRAARSPGGAARVARAARRGRRRRAPAARARPARRRAVAARQPGAAAARGTHARDRGRRAGERCSTARRRSCRRASRSCASWPAASIRRADRARARAGAAGARRARARCP